MFRSFCILHSTLNMDFDKINKPSTDATLQSDRRVLLPRNNEIKSKEYVIFSIIDLYDDDNGVGL